MLFSVQITGRRLSDGHDYELILQLEAANEYTLLDYLDQAYDWTDAATRAVHIVAVPLSIE